ncbi:prepilin peptidase, partial [Candidatus Roizmanbacteria bacterium]|nr:prepilin peptidase [Candidatus Roizmanbacteria bacterium]
FFAISGAVWDIFVERMVAAAIVMAPILFLFLVTRGRGMGFGDVKLAFVLGFLLGWLPGLLSLYFAFIFGAIYGLGLIATHKGKMKSKIAFGPFIVLGMLIMIFFQQPVYFLIHIIYGI